MEHKYKVSERGPKRRYYIREIGITVISGLGRFGGGGGLARDFYRQNLVVHLGLGRASWQGTQGLPPSFRRPLWPSSRAGFAPIPTKSGASRASGLICGSRERRRPGPAHRGPGRTRAGGGRAGELVDQGQRRPRAGHCRRLWERLWGRRLELGANTYRVLVHPTEFPPQAGSWESLAWEPASSTGVSVPLKKWFETMGGATQARSARLPRE